MAKIDTGLASLILVAKHYKITADMRQLERAYVLEEGSVDTFGFYIPHKSIVNHLSVNVNRRPALCADCIAVRTGKSNCIASVCLKHCRDSLVAPSGIDHRNHFQRLFVSNPSPLYHHRCHPESLLHLACHHSAPVDQYFRAENFSEIFQEIAQHHWIIDYIPSYLEYLDHRLKRISLRTVWAETTLLAASGMTID